MSKVKAILVVVLLVGGGGAGALLGLNSFYQARIDGLVHCAMAGADQQFVDHLRVEAFQAIQRLSRESQNPEVLEAMGKVRTIAADTEIDSAKSTLQSPHDDLVPLLEKLQKKTRSDILFVLSTDGRVVAQLPDRDNFGESMKGIPAVAECLAGISRDGFYELSGKPHAVAATPLMDNRGKLEGCLMSANAMNETNLQAMAKQTGLEAALFLRKTIVASTMDRNSLKPLLSLLNTKKIIRFGNLPDAPLLTDFSGKGFVAKTVRLDGGTDPMHLAVILPVAGLVAPLKDAQMTLLMGIGALLIVGLLLGILLSGRSESREAQRLLDAVRNLADGSTSVLNEAGYSGVYQDLAHSISNLVSASPRTVRTPVSAAATAASGNGLGLQSPLDSGPPEAPEPGDLDFESLLGGARKSQPAPARKPEAPPVSAQPPEPAPAETAGSELPADLFAPAEPEPEPPPVKPEPTEPPVSTGGPKVELPGELAGMFDEDTVEASAIPPAAPEAVPAQAPPPPPSIPPSPPDLSEDQDQIKSSDYRPDATVIAQVPDELLKAAFTMEQQAAEAPPPSPIRAVEESPEEAHFREVFQQFVNTKKQCGESTVGLTFDRFAEKLRKNTSDLMARYSCRTVKFHVYVKNGKAALKATPLK